MRLLLCVCGIALGWATPVMAALDDGPATTESAQVDPGTLLPFQLKLAAGYALRLAPDGRTSGGGAVAQADVPIWGAFGARVGALGMGFAGSIADPRPLAFGGAHGSLLYAVDEGNIAGRIHAGGLIGYTAEVDFTGAFDELPRRDGVYAGVVLCLLYTSPSPRDLSTSRMPSSA